MANAFDLDGYCARIGYPGDRSPTLPVLQAIHRCHAQAIPFDNLDPLVGITPRLDMRSLEEKLVRDRRGGYCFEQNLLFRHALDHMGFRVTNLVGRVLWDVPPHVVTARTHMVLRVDLPDGLYLADVGFGRMTLTAPLRLVADVEQATPHEALRLVAVDGGFRAEARLGADWRPLYRFDLQEQHLIDYELSNWYLANHPQSYFVTNLMAARVEVDRRYTMRNAELGIHHLSGRTERCTLTTVTELKAALTGPLSLILPDHPNLDATLERLVTNR
jgi:N-hydroxyarylamine O-acetyltransferase